MHFSKSSTSIQDVASILKSPFLWKYILKWFWSVKGTVND